MANGLIRKTANNQQAEVLMNRGKQLLRIINAIPNFFDNKESYESFLSALSNRTIIGEDGSYLKIRRGPIDSSRAFVPVIAKKKEEAVSAEFVDLYAGIIVIDINTGEEIGIYVSRLPEMNSWKFVPCTIPPLNNYSNRGSDSDYELEMTGDPFGQYVELIPNLGLHGVYPISEDVPVYVISSRVVTVYETDPYPAGRPLDANAHPWEGEEACGTSYYRPSNGIWYFSRDGGSPDIAYPNPYTNVVALGERVQVNITQIRRDFVSTLYSVKEVVSEAWVDTEETITFPVSSEGWEYAQTITNNSVRGYHYASGKASKSIDGRIDYALAGYDATNTWTTYRSYPAVTNIDKSEYPQTRYFRVQFADTIHTLETALVGSYSASATSYILRTSPKYVSIEEGEFYGLAYTESPGVSHFDTQFTAVVCFGTECFTHQFPGSASGIMIDDDKRLKTNSLMIMRRKS